MSFVVLLLAGFAAPVSADPAPPYNELLRRSLDQAPALLEQAAKIRAASQDARQARALPNPIAGVEFENIGGSTAPGSSTQPQTTFTLTQPFEIGGKRSARIAAGKAGIAAAEAEGRLVQVDYAARLAIAYATAEATQQRLQLAEDDLVRANEDLRAAGALVQAGKEADLRLAQARASLSAATAVREGAIADLTEALANLSALAGVAEPYSSVDSSFLVSEALSGPVAGPMLDQSPAVAVAKAERDAMAAQMRVEQVKPVPDIGLMGGLRRFGGTGDTSVVVGVTASIPIFNRNGGGIAAAKERQGAAEQRLAGAMLDADAARRTALARVTASQGRLRAAGDGEVAAAEAYRLGRIGYEAGKTSLLELLVLRRSLTDARALTIDARLARISALAALARIDGRIAFGD
ncbi:TolC family protein [Sphingobium sp. H39-3-25]|uniref:TolC family protein n=1 Tax=Sphingobium arseniciresistens TaxID=3030834 RepID=UPI0023B965E2|nr:TolC family protein [Sphingobium arseniciresistens]